MKKIMKDFSFLKSLGILFVLLLLSYFLFRDINEFVEEVLMTAVSVEGFVFLVSFLVFLVQFIGKLSGKLVGISERKIKQLDKTDLKFEKEYYREILKNNSPLILGYLDNLELSKNKIISEILFLEMRNLICIDAGKINKVVNNEKTNLLKSEEMVMDYFASNNLNTEDEKQFLIKLKEQVICEAKAISLVTEKSYKKEMQRKKIDWKKIIDKYIRNYYIWNSFII